jgi:hypothetical protein
MQTFTDFIRSRRITDSPRGAFIEDTKSLIRCGKQRLRNGEAECFCGPEVEYQLELGRLHHRQIGRFLAMENLPWVDAKLAVRVGDARALREFVDAGGLMSYGTHSRQLILEHRPEPQQK